MQEPNAVPPVGNGGADVRATNSGAPVPMDPHDNADPGDQHQEA